MALGGEALLRKMAVQWSLSQVCVALFLLQMAAAHVYDTDLNLNSRHEGPLLFRGSLLTQTNASQGSHGNDTSTSLYVKGFVSLTMTVIGFGSSLVPIKRTETGDGFFFQWVFCTAMWLESLPVHFIQGSSQTWALSTLAGCLFAIGNLTTIPIIRTIGLGLGSLIWSSFCLLIGWASARFGWFGLDPQEVARPLLNYLGTALAAVSVLILFFMKTEVRRKDEQGEKDTEPLLPEDPDNSYQKLDKPTDVELDECILSQQTEEPWENKLSDLQRKIIGCSLASFAGLLYGSCYTPIIYVKNSAMKNITFFTGASQYDLDYIFPFMNGACATTSAIFFVYCVLTKNRPHLAPKCVLPAFLAGSLQFGSQVSWFLSCYYLGAVITYPIGTAGPALVALAWSVFCFREIKGLKNFILLGVVLITVLTGITLITVSKIN